MQQDNHNTDNQETVIVGMSGGVDSSVSAALLKKSGYHVIGMTMVLWKADDPFFPGASSAVASAKAVCDSLEIEHQVWDLSDIFAATVIDYFENEYLAGRTPNPCVQCNRFIKWGEVIRRAKESGARYVATGHYVRCAMNTESGRYEIRKALDPKKDQSYVLWGLSQGALSMALFPLGDSDKNRTRALAKEWNLPSAHHKESQEICFIPEDNYKKFLLSRRDELRHMQGNICTEDGRVVGKHDGYLFYTIGQRRGVGVSMNRPVYVTAVDAKSNTITVGREEELFAKGLTAKSVNFIPFERPMEPLRVTAKIRYNDPGHPATITHTGSDSAEVIFDEPQRAITPGQSAVFYRNDLLIGGGIIDRVIR